MMSPGRFFFENRGVEYYWRHLSKRAKSCEKTRRRSRRRALDLILSSQACGMRPQPLPMALPVRSAPALHAGFPISAFAAVASVAKIPASWAAHMLS